MNNAKQIILIAGRARSGKDTTAGIINQILLKKGYNQEDINITHFADKLKELSYALLKDFYPELSEKAFHEDKDNHNEFLNAKNRTFLQYLGTHARNILGKNIWVETVKITDGINIIPDHRFENERITLERLYPEHNLKTIRIFRQSIDSNTEISHESEKINFDCNLNIYNNGSISDLENTINDNFDRIID